MLIKDIFGKVITNIYIVHGVEQGWLDTADCFIELDNSLIIDIPFGEAEDVWIRELDPRAKSLFENLNDIPVYHVNKERQSIGEIAGAYKKRKKNIFYRLKKKIFGEDPLPGEYEPYKIEYRENKLKYIQNQKIVDFLWYEDEVDKGFWLLDNGYLITETRMSPSGTGLAGLTYYQSLEALEHSKGSNLKIYSKEFPA